MKVYKIWNRERGEYLSTNKSIWTSLKNARCAITCQQDWYTSRSPGSRFFLGDLEIHEFTLSSPVVHSAIREG